jgi:hypothetical protein
VCIKKNLCAYVVVLSLHSASSGIGGGERKMWIMNTWNYDGLLVEGPRRTFHGHLCEGSTFGDVVPMPVGVESSKWPELWRNVLYPVLFRFLLQRHIGYRFYQ